MEFFKVSKCDFTFIREMREATFKFLIKNQHFLQFLTLGLVHSVIDFFIMIFLLFLCFRRLIYFGLVGLDEHHQYIYAYPILKSTWIYGFHDGDLGLDLARVGWNGVRSGTSLADVK